jgi:hypothetical protein
MFHWKNVPVNTATIVTDWMTARQIKLVEHPPYLPDLAPVVHFLFLKAKRELAGFTLTQEKFKKEWEGGCLEYRGAGLCGGVPPLVSAP